MKKLLLTLGCILLVIYAVLTALSWGDGYRSERKLWRLNHEFSYLATHNDSTPDFAFEQMARKYRAFIQQSPSAIFAARGQMMLGNLYAVRKDYPHARDEYQKAVGSDDEISAQAQMSTAKTYELENNWQQAHDTYQQIVKDYPTTNTGFFVSMYLAKHDDSYDSALTFYQNLANQHPKSTLEYNALRMIALCQLNQHDWQATVQTMRDMILKYPKAMAIKEAVNTINLLTVTRLHDYDMGIQIYQQFIQKYPDHPADPLLQKMIKDLQLLKSKNLNIRFGQAPLPKKL